MIGWVRAFVLLLALAWLPAASCAGQPSKPLPSAIGGATATGGTTDAGGTLPDGTLSGVGGSTAMSVAIRFPACNPASHVAKAIDPAKVKLGRRHGPIVRARKASYEIDADAVSTFWQATVPWALDQGNIGACAGFAIVQARLSRPFTLATIPGTPTTLAAFEQLARDVYGGATRRDIWEGSWPPDDTGSSGSAALDEALERGLFAGYSTLTNLADVQRALQFGPVPFGVDWYDGMFTPSRCGEIKVTGKNRGGHEITLVGLDVQDKKVWGLTSWGNKHGVCLDDHCGYFYMSYGMVAQLFAQGGEAERPVGY